MQRVRLILGLLLVLPFLSEARLCAAPENARQPAATRGLLLDACVVGPLVFAVGDHGAVIRSDDSGKTWSAILIPVGGTFTGIAFSDTHYGWIAGHGATILASSDGGLSWAEQAINASRETSLLDLAISDARHVIAVGSFGACFSTSDAGHSWVARKVLNEELHLNSVSHGKGAELFIAGERGTLLRLANFRADPTPLTPGYAGSFNGVLLLADGSLLTYGLRGHAYRSGNDGKTWSAVPHLPPILLSTAVQLKSGVVVLAGQARHVLVSSDNGRTFSAWQTPLTTAVAKLIEAPDGALLCFGEGGVTRLEPPALAKSPARP